MLTAAYDASTGNQLWANPLAEPLRSQLANDLAFAPDGSRVYVIANSRPNIPDTKLLDQEVIAYNLIDGSTAWSVHLDSGPGNAMSGDKVAIAPDGNSVITLGISPVQAYHKVHLVPFGEFAPPGLAWTLQLVFFVLIVQGGLTLIENTVFRYRAVSERAI